MTVACKMRGCPFYNAANFCSKPSVVNIDQNGMCGQIWRKGVQKQNIPPVIKREVINILEAEIKDEVEKILDEKEVADASSEDRTNGTAAFHEQKTKENDSKESPAIQEGVEGSQHESS